MAKGQGYLDVKFQGWKSSITGLVDSVPGESLPSGLETAFFLSDSLKHVPESFTLPQKDHHNLLWIVLFLAPLTLHFLYLESSLKSQGLA